MTRSISTERAPALQVQLLAISPLVRRSDYISLHLPATRYRAIGGWCVAPVDETHRPSGQLRRGASSMSRPWAKPGRAPSPAAALDVSPMSPWKPIPPCAGEERLILTPSPRSFHG